MTIKLILQEEHRPFTIAKRFGEQEAIVVNSMKELLEAQHNNLPTSMFMHHPEENTWTRIRIRALFPKLQENEAALTNGVQFWKLYGSGQDQHPFATPVGHQAITNYRELVAQGWQVLFARLPDIDWSNPFLGMVDVIRHDTGDRYIAADKDDQKLMTLTKQGVVDLIKSHPTHFTLETI